VVPFPRKNMPNDITREPEMFENSPEESGLSGGRIGGLENGTKGRERTADQ